MQSLDGSVGMRTRTTEESCFNSRLGQDVFLFSSAYGPSQCPTQSSSQWIREASPEESGWSLSAILCSLDLSNSIIEYVQK